MNITTRTLRQAALIIVIVICTTLYASSGAYAHWPRGSFHQAHDVGIDTISPIPSVVMNDATGTFEVLLINSEGARKVAELQGIHSGITMAQSIHVKLSPKGGYVACLYDANDSGSTTLTIINISDGKTAFTTTTSPFTREQAFSQIPSFLWMSEDELSFTKVTYPKTDTTSDTQDQLNFSGELWKVTVSNEKAERLATGQIFRVLGFSNDRLDAYITRIIPFHSLAEWRREGFGIIRLDKGESKYLWPTDEEAKRIVTGEADTYYDFQIVNGSDEQQQLTFFTRHLGNSPYVVQVADLATETAKTRQTLGVAQVSTDKGREYIEYVDPYQVIWSPSTGQMIPNPWQLSSALGKFDEWLIGHSGNDVVTQDGSNIVRFWSEDGTLLKELLLHQSEKPALAFASGKDVLYTPASTNYVSNAAINWSVPYLHQLRDTEDAFDGHGACGPTSAVMALAYFNKLRPNPLWIPAFQRFTVFGRYVTHQYSATPACVSAQNYNQTKPDFLGHGAFAGANGQVYVASSGSDVNMINSYLRSQDLGTYLQFGATPNALKQELDGGAIVILGTTQTTAGHILVVRGYTTSGDNFIINDPAGYINNTGGIDWNANGEERIYSWNDLTTRGGPPVWYLAVYGSHYLTNVRYDTIAQSSIAIQNSYGTYGANVDVCLMDPSGTKNAGSKSVWISANGRYSFGSSDLPWGFAGSAVIRPNQTGVGSVLLNSNPWKIYDYASTRSELATNESYIPWYACNFNSWNSTLTVQNANTLSESNAVTAYHYNQWGNLVAQQTITLSPWQQNTLNLCSGSGYYGSVKLVGENGKPIAASVVHQHPTVDSIAYEGVSFPRSIANAPSLVKNFANGYQSSLNFQSLASNSVYIDYYGAVQYSKPVSVNGSTVAYLPDEPIQAYAWSGAASMSTAGPMAVAEHFASPNGGALGYPLVSKTYPRLIMPRIRTDRAMSKDASITILNPSYGSVAVTVSLYSVNGALASSYNLSIQPRSTVSLYYEIPNTFDGSGVIIGVNGAPVAAVVHESDGSSKSVGYEALPLGNIVP